MNIHSYKSIFRIVVLLFFTSILGRAASLSLKETAAGPSDFPLVVNQQAAKILVDKNDAEVVRIAGEMLATDIERVSGVKPVVEEASEKPSGPIVILGTLGKDARIADLVKRDELQVDGLEQKWESFLIQIVENPFPGVPSALVIVGSDRRGTAYGAVTISETIGVSPWVWWADASPIPRKTLVLSAGNYMEGPPSVKYRGIFLNDEDWGLLPWAAKTFEPEHKNIGPKTYTRIFELLLRLKANYLWPAMHDPTRAFNFFPENKLIADRYAIVMGSSHCEQMLRNNVTEWPKKERNLWNPVTNLPAIVEYWEQRVQENGKFENTYTVGMRGIHDTGMPGGGTLSEKRERLENIIQIQRGLLSKHVNPDASKVPQIFCPYKEVLDVYQDGMKLPDDITLVWPDDNYGYIRQLPDAVERERSGGSGIYYHLSYLGRPHPYLWLDSTSPALIWHEMSKAYELGARKLWVVNVGDIKPIEAGTTLFLQLAWNIDRYGPDAQADFLRDFYSRQFGEEYGAEIAKLMDGYFRLCAIRRPDNMGFNTWGRGREPVRDSYWSHDPENDEAQQIQDRWLELAGKATDIGAKLPPAFDHAYFQLVEYPVCAGAALVEKIITAEKVRVLDAQDLIPRAEAAFKRVLDLTKEYNSLNDGKWRGMMDYRPIKLSVYREPSFTKPADGKAGPQQAPEPKNRITVDVTGFTKTGERDGTGWKVIEGLGPRGRALTVLPRKDRPTLRDPKQIREGAPYVEYRVEMPREGEVEVMLEALPTHGFTPRHEVIAAVSVNEGDPVLLRFNKGKDNEYDPTWQANVLRSAMDGKIKMQMPAGHSTLKVWAADPALVLQHVTLTPMGDL
ncbi:MAG: glycosyl hydrolase 115 family protein [Luteolibacter sp.]